MHLKLLCVRGYKRFDARSCLDTRPPVVAVVGPNEAGKTSLLRAAEYLSNDNAIPQRELTDRKPDDGGWVISAHYSLEPEERELIRRWVPKSSDFTYVTSRQASGKFVYDITPRPLRRLKPREKAKSALDRALEHGWVSDEPDEESGRSLRHRAAAMAQRLDTDADTLGDDSRAELRDGARAFADARKDNEPRAMALLCEALERAAEAEDEDSPAEQINDILWRRRPAFLFFDSARRDLRSEYIWAQTATPPPALADLFELAGVDFDEFRTAAVDDDRPTVDTLRERADHNLEKAFGAWNQEKLHISFSSTPESLQLIIRIAATGGRSELTEHSEGLLSFISLFSFTETRAGGRRPVLLIDEAEQHLHYDGQADLVQVFERQDIADTILYTTHSIGCLPNDLGAALRAVIRLPGEQPRSAIKNSFWAAVDEGERVGLSPMMVAMGAETFAFTPARHAVIGEGAAEAILLPSLIRESLPEAERRKPLGYQVAPGVSEVHPEQAGFLEHEAGSVVYLVDSDRGGRDHGRKLPQRAKDEGRVLMLDEQEQDVSLEDFVDAETLVRALAKILQRQGIGSAPPKAKDLPQAGRSAYVAKWCQRRKLRLADHKGELAQSVLSVGRERGILIEASRRKQLQALHRRLVRATGATHSS